MILKNKDKEFELQYTMGAFTSLKKILKCDNLRTTLLQAARKEDYEILTKAVKEFSGGEIARSDAAYPLMDAYVKESGLTYYDLFLQFISEIGEAGFFKEKATPAELKELAENPDWDLDMDELSEEAMRIFKGEMLQNIVKGMTRDMMRQNTTTTGAATLKPSVPQLTSAE